LQHEEVPKSVDAAITILNYEYRGADSLSIDYDRNVALQAVADFYHRLKYDNPKYARKLVKAASKTKSVLYLFSIGNQHSVDLGTDILGYYNSEQTKAAYILLFGAFGSSICFHAANHGKNGLPYALLASIPISISIFSYAVNKYNRAADAKAKANSLTLNSS
jgi:hypothetical protein